MAIFIHGRELSRLLHDEVVQPLIRQYFPGLNYSSGLFGYGSEVLGFDTEMSRDHDWGPRLQLFLTPEDLSIYKSDLIDLFSTHLPHEFHGYSTHFGKPNENDKGTRHLEKLDSGPICHRIEVHSLRNYLDDYLPVNGKSPMDEIDWLIIPQQKLRTIIEGSIFYDGLDILNSMVQKYQWYPDDVWFYLLASAWSRIGQEEHLMGRCGTVGDEIGSALLADSIVRTMMQICYFMEKKYAPYPKWFGTAFQQLNCAEEISPLILKVQTSTNWEQRQNAFCVLSRYVIQLFNTMHLVDPISDECTLFFGRPYSVIWGDGIADKLRQLIHDPQFSAVPLIGNVDIISSSTDVLENSNVCRSFRDLYTI